MKISVHEAEKLSLEAIRGFVEASERLRFESESREQVYGWVDAPVAKLLNKLLIEQTKSRPLQSGDNGLVETKNGAVIRKHIGFGHIRAAHAEPIQRFYAEHLNPSLNFHRPCAQADPEIDARGRIRRSYKRYQTTFEMLLALDQPAQYLRDGLELATLNRNAGALSDTDAARRMQQAKATLFDRLRLAG